MLKITIVTPMFNSAKYIERCILSIKNQTYKNYEHIVVDGGSTDGSLEIVKKYLGSYNLILISEPDNGMYDAICKGFERATGDIFAWLNSDDMYQPYALEIMNDVISMKKAVWCTGIPVIYSPEDIIYDIPRFIPVYFRWLMRLGYPGQGGCGLQQESTFWTRELWEKAQGDDIKDYRFAGDFVLWRKFSEFADLKTVNIIISGFRKHEGQKSDNKEAYKKERGKWTIINIILKVFAIPKLFSIVYALLGGKKIIRYSDMR